MVKGVSKTIIEVKNTGSQLFEKIVFYVTPEYSTLSAKQLKKAAGNFCFHYDLPRKNESLRKRYKRKILLRNICIAVTAVCLSAILLIAIL